jgi:hypothetical protein
MWVVDYFGVSGLARSVDAKVGGAQLCPFEVVQTNSRVGLSTIAAIGRTSTGDPVD